MNKVIVSEFEDKIVFTTTDRESAKLILLVCDDANITDSEDEYHCQAWITKNHNPISN